MAEQSADAPKLYFCEKCGRLKKGIEFYTSLNLEKFPNDGKLPLCKECITMHVDNWEPETFLPILEEIDVPYDKESWDELLKRYGQDPTKVTGKTILGHYLSKMKLKPWNKLRYADTERIASEKREQKRQSLIAGGYSPEQVEELLAADYTPPQPEANKDAIWRQQTMDSGRPSITEKKKIEDDLASVLTEEDKHMLAIKWGYAYKPSEWVQLEQFYNDMMESYDIQGAGHIDTLKLVCKTSLKANQMLDLGDIESFQKMSKAYDALMKSGKFTAAQNKAAVEGQLDSISELVAICEREGFIPRYYTDGPQDKVDLVLQDMQQYTKTLVTEELNLGNLIENSMKMIQDQMKKESQIDVDDDEEEFDEDAIYEKSLFEDTVKFLEDKDYDELREMEEEAEEEDYNYLKSLEEE